MFLKPGALPTDARYVYHEEPECALDVAHAYRTNYPLRGDVQLARLGRRLDGSRALLSVASFGDEPIGLLRS